MNSRWPIIAILGTTQALAWASSFYLPAVLAQPMARDLGLTAPWIYAALSCALFVTAALGPFCGRMIDERGGRGMLVISNVLFAAGLCVLAAARGPISLFAAWLVLGVAMAAGLYEAAFAALTRLYAADARAPITGITLIAGFSSTVGWPLTAWFEHTWGWRGACLAWAVLNGVLALPLNAWALRHTPPPIRTESEAIASSSGLVSQSDKRMWILAWVFTTGGIVSIGIATNLPGLFAAMGASSTAAIAAASLMGPAQVGARIVEFSAKRWATPLISARVGGALHPIGAAILAIVGAPAIAVFAVVHGACNGIFTIIRGTLPLSLFGPVGYGARIGKISAPARIGQAIAPFLFGVVIERYGAGLLWISSALSVLALLGLFNGSLSAHRAGQEANSR